jgi:hypothetical protein
MVMDTNIILNLTIDDQAPVVTAKNVKKGGRWTDRYVDFVDFPERKIIP